MTRILGIVGSARRWGNSELMVRQVLRGAQSEGASTQMLRLTDLRLEPCTGCMRCVIGSEPCRVDDDMAWLVDRIQEADGLALAAPTYFLGPAAVVKIVLDRLLMVTGCAQDGQSPARPAVTIITAGLEGWRGVSLPYLNTLVAAFGYQTIESLTAVSPGPGEVLLDDDLMAQTLAAGQRLGREELDPAHAPPGVCPVCRCDSFILQGDRAVCPICAREAAIEYKDGTVRLRFDAADAGDHRWTAERLHSHLEHWVRATGPRFMAQRSEIKERRRPYRAMDPGWICPPSDI